jgi:hypothetical protein
LLHVASLVVALALGFLLLILPCCATRARPTARTALLFFTLGVAYMFVEMWAIYKLVLVLSHQTFAAAVVLTAMLAASGAGATVLVRAEAMPRSRMVIRVLLCAMLALSVADFLLLTFIGSSQPLLIRCLFGALWIAVPAFFMGFPFPFALERLRRQAEIPWALALNGFGSVLGGLVATLVAVHFGLTALALTAVGLYLLVAIFLSGRKDSGTMAVPSGSAQIG